MTDPAPLDVDEVIARTREWVEKAVIGLTLCPFAAPVHAAQRIRYRVSLARNLVSLQDDLLDELERLNEADPAQVETTLLIHPLVLTDFLDFNEYLDEAERALETLELTGVLQVASFHPQYQFEGTQPGDIENFTNRSPYPTLHLLREESIENAVAAFPDPDSIYERNIETLRRLGHEGWQRLWRTDKKP
jgi:hypothetical protein